MQLNPESGRIRNFDNWRVSRDIRNSVKQTSGTEFLLREIGVLFLVFVPLDAAFYQGDLKVATIACLGVLVLAGLALVGAGIFLERR